MISEEELNEMRTIANLPVPTIKTKVDEELRNFKSIARIMICRISFYVKISTS